MDGWDSLAQCLCLSPRSSGFLHGVCAICARFVFLLLESRGPKQAVHSTGLTESADLHVLDSELDPPSHGTHKRILQSNLSCWRSGQRPVKLGWMLLGDLWRRERHRGFICAMQPSRVECVRKPRIHIRLPTVCGCWYRHIINWQQEQFGTLALVCGYELWPPFCALALVYHYFEVYEIKNGTVFLKKDDEDLCGPWNAKMPAVNWAWAPGCFDPRALNVPH